MQLRTYSNIVEQKMDNNRTKNFWRDQLSGDVWRKLGTKCQAMRHTLSWSSVTCYAENPAAFAAEDLNSPHHSQTPISFHREAQTQQPAPQRTQAAFITKSTNSQHGLRRGKMLLYPLQKGITIVLPWDQGCHHLFTLSTPNSRATAAPPAPTLHTLAPSPVCVHPRSRLQPCGCSTHAHISRIRVNATTG